MERRKCRRCGHPMTRLLTNDAGKWSACYTCLSCGCETATVTAKSKTAAEDGLERLMDRVDRAHEDDRRSAAPTKPDRLLKVYDLYCQMCETLTGEINPEPDVLRDALQKAKRELEAYKGAGLRYEDGRTAGINGTYQICFAAVCLALNDIHGFGGKRCHRVLEKMQRYIVDCFTSADAVQAVYKRMGLKLDFGDPLNWIELEDED